MALVHIEMSEYKAMEAKAEMLEEMRQTERKLHEEIKSIEQKKNEELKALIDENKKLLEEEYKKTLQAYKDAEKKVIKTVTNETNEYVQIVNDNTDNAIREFIISLNLPKGIGYEIINTLERHNGKSEGFTRFSNYSSSIDFHKLANSLFRIEKRVSTPKTTVTTHGLDEIKVELKEEIERNINAEIKEKLGELDNLHKKLPKILKENDELAREIVVIKQKHMKLFEENIELNEKNKELNETNFDINDKINTVESKIENAEWWNAPSVIKYLKNTVKNW